MLFYLIFGASLLLPVQNRLYATLGVLAGLVIIGLWSTAGAHPVVAFYTSDIILEFGLGLLIGNLVTKRVSISPMLSWSAFLCGVFLISCLGLKHSGLRSLVWGLPAGLIVAGALSLELQGRLREFWLLHFLGNASYSIYLSHEIVIAAMGQFWITHGFGSSAPAKIIMIVTMMIVAAFAGGAVHLCIEKPLLCLLQGKSLKTALLEGFLHKRPRERILGTETPLNEAI
jgi:peptidoglycan/LPS O-acetylase OafA/YrhL